MTNTLINNTWGLPVLFNAPTGQNNRQHPDVASRFIETRRICFRKGNYLFTNTEYVNPDGPAFGGAYQRIATNGGNLTDQFLVFVWQQAQKRIALYQIDP